MLDLHANYDGTGSTSLVTYTAIPSGDGAVVAGVPILTEKGKAKLVGWGGMGVDATKAPKSWGLYSNDLIDPANGSQMTPVGTSIAVATPLMMEWLPYMSAARVVKIAQKAAGLVLIYTIDHYESADIRALGAISGSRMPPNRGLYSKAFGGALTAQAWGSVAFTATYNLPAGRYAILGAAVSGLTNVALLRFQHSDFGAAQPGFPVAEKFAVDPTLPAIGGGQTFFLEDLYQFVRLSELTGKPQCPVFRAGPNGTGLSVWCIDNTADTPTVVLNLAYLGA